MAKRRRLTAPDMAELERLEKDFTPGLETKSMVPPIAQVAAEAAANTAVGTAEERVHLAQDKADAIRFRAAEEAGLVVKEIPLSEISTDYFSRDRIDLDPAQMAELVASLRNHGQRTPIEVMQLPDQTGYGLISGWRRWSALTQLFNETGSPDFSVIQAFIRVPEHASDAYIAMVEENEIRANLSHYERGRLAVVSASQGVFQSVEDAVDHLFSAASKSKRSKIRSFATIHEELGDVLTFPTKLTERAGLQLAISLRVQGAEPFRRALVEKELPTPQAEAAVLDRVIAAATGAKDLSRGGRPATKTRVVEKLQPLALSEGGQVFAELSEDRLTITVTGKTLSADVARLLQERVRNTVNRQ